MAAKRVVVQYKLIWMDELFVTSVENKTFWWEKCDFLQILTNMQIRNMQIS